MVYMRFSLIGMNTWEVSEPVKSAQPIATATRGSGQTVAMIAEGQRLNGEETAALSTFMLGQEKQ